MPTGNNTGKYIEFAVNSGMIGNPQETTQFNLAMAFILANIEKPEPEIVRAAFATAPDHIIEYFAADRWFTCQPDPKMVPIYSTIAREILMERILLGGAERK